MIPNLLSYRNFAFDSDHKKDLHSHEVDSLFVPLEGNIFLECGQFLFIATYGSAIFVPRGIMHQGQMFGGTKGFNLYFKEPNTLLSKKPTSILINELCLALMKDLIDENQEVQDELICLKKFELLVHELNISKSSPFCLQTYENKTFQKITDMIIKAPHEKRSLAYLANHFGMSERTLSRLFKKETGMTYSQWKNRLYLMLSFRALLEGTSVTNIAYDLGYETSSSFIYQFKKTLGVTPKVFLKNQLQSILKKNGN